MEPYSAGPESTWLSLAVDLVVLICILASCTVVVVEWIHPHLTPTLHPLEVIFTTIFVVEYLLRWYSADNRWLYPVTALAIIDLLAILPGVLALSSDLLMLRMIRGARLLRLLRLLRLIRLLRLLRYGPLIYRGLLRARVWFSSLTFQYRLAQLGRLFLWAAVALFVGANTLHITETAMVGEQGPFSGYWSSYWNILIVLVSGIEDKEPLSLLGRVEVTVLLIAGIVIVGMLTGEIVSILIRRVQRAGMVNLKPPKARFERHIVILGSSPHVDNVIRQIHSALKGQHHVLVVHPEADQLPVTDATVYRRVFALTGEPREARILEEADIDDAARVIVLAPLEDGCEGRGADNQALMATVAVICRKCCIPLVVELTDEDSLRYTHGLPEVDFVVGRAFGERMISQAVLNPGVTEVYDHLLTFTDDSNEIYTVPVPKHLVGKTFADAQLHFLEHDGEVIAPIGIDRLDGDRAESRFFLCPAAPEAGLTEEQRVLRADDRLIVMAYERPAAVAETADRWSTTWLARV
jgi:voltage-gated potassium channel